jgi:hypothetical protein
MGASFFTVLSPAKFGRLWPYCVREVALGFWKCTEVHFLPLIGTFDALKVIEVFPDASYEQAWRLMDEIKTLAKPQLYNVADPVSQGGAQMEEGETGHGPSIVIMIANGRFEIQT